MLLQGIDHAKKQSLMHEQPCEHMPATTPCMLEVV